VTRVPQFAQQLHHRRAEVHKGADVSLRFGQPQHAFEQGAGLNLMTVRACRKRLEHNDLQYPAHASGSLGSGQQACQEVLRVVEPLLR
jgi:hypothetical protein